MKSAKSYNSYKPSGIGWVPSIPENWEIVDTKRCFNFPKEIVGEDFVNYKVLSLSVNGVIFRNVASGAGKQHSDMGTYQIIKPDSIVLCLFDMDVTPRIVGHSDKTGIITSAYVNIIPKENISSKYYYYYFILQDFNKYLFSQGTGIRTTLTRSQFGALKIALPSFEEQTAIARFLDYKLAKINRFIQKKKQLIKLLNEQKAAIINQAVTKGLDPNTKMKDSGIEWLGEIPEHWEKYKLKYLISKPIAGTWGTEPQNDDNDITCVRVADFSEYEIKTDNLTIRNIEAKTEQILKPGDLLLEKSGGGEKTPVGRVVLFNQSFKAVTSNFISKFSPKIDLLSSEYLLYIFKLINSVRWNFRSLKQTTGIQNIDTYQYMDNWVFIPKIEEQTTIVNHIKNEFKVLDETISKIEKEIALVEEYKTALIAEAVTGKIDVRGYEVPEISEEETYEEIEEEISMAAEDAEEYETIETE